MKILTRHSIILIIIPLVIFITDQLLKIVVIRYFTYHINTGFSWGILSGNNFPAMIFSSLITIVALIALFFEFTWRSPLRYILVSLVAASCSNILDRLVRGGVVDYISILYFPSFNFADIIITISIIGLILGIIFYEKKIYSR